MTLRMTERAQSIAARSIAARPIAAQSIAGLCALAFLGGTRVAAAQDPFQSTPGMQAPPSAQPPVIQPIPEGMGAPSAAPGAFAAPPPPAPPGLPPMAEPPSVESSAKESSPLKLSAFVDAYYGFQTQALGTPVPFHRAYGFNAPGVDENGNFAPTAQNGFSLSFAGVDVKYDGGALGATMSLRAGPSVPLFYASDNGPLGIDNITQAYATWTPVPEFSLDFGQFNTIFGAEVAESWQNLNYTRGALYYAMQPFWHTGLRATISPNDQVAVTAMIVNGVNSVTETNDSPSLALQLSATPTDSFSAALGWLTTPKPSTDGGVFGNFFDLVAAVTVDRFSLVFNADLAVNRTQHIVTDSYEQTLGTPMYWGLSLAAGYQATDIFGLALRGEFLSDADNMLYQVQSQSLARNGTLVTYPSTTQTNLMTLTGTLDFKPVPGSSNLIIRWDNRLETSNRDIFYNRDSQPAEVWFGSILGLVVTTDN